jgi:hypothetical protein
VRVIGAAVFLLVPKNDLLTNLKKPVPVKKNLSFPGGTTSSDCGG